MGGVSPGVWLIVSLVLVAGMLAGFFSARGRRRRALSAQVDAHGWVYKGSQISLTRRWPGEPFIEGTRQEAHDIITGNCDGNPFVSFGYLAAQGEGEELAPHHVIVIPLPDGAPPATPAQPGALPGGFSWRQAGEDVLAWRAGDQDLDVICPVVSALNATEATQGASAPEPQE